MFPFRRSNDVKDVVSGIVNPSGIVKYNVVYIPKLHGYKITLVSKTGEVNASYVAEIIGKLTEKGYTVMLQNPRTMLGRGGVITLFASKSEGK